jgi:hypothetical protein
MMGGNYSGTRAQQLFERPTRAHSMTFVVLINQPRHDRARAQETHCARSMMKLKTINSNN